MEMVRNYQAMKDAWWKGEDKYFQCKANCEAATRGPGGNAAATVISEGRELYGKYVKGDPDSDSQADQEANKHGRKSGKANMDCKNACDPCRPKGLPDKW